MRDKAQLEQHYDAHAFKNYDSSAALRWSEFSTAFPQGAQSAIATLALAPKCIVL